MEKNWLTRITFVNKKEAHGKFGFPSMERDGIRCEGVQAPLPARRQGL
jgi:hypothetical protein